MFRIILGIVVGFVLWSVIWLGGNPLILRLFPGAVDEQGEVRGAGVLLALLVLSVIASVASGYLTTVIAQDPSITPGLILGVILLIVGILVQRSAWNLMPLWYHLVFLGLLIPGSVLGWWLRT